MFGREVVMMAYFVGFGIVFAIARLLFSVARAVVCVTADVACGVAEAISEARSDVQ